MTIQRFKTLPAFSGYIIPPGTNNGDYLQWNSRYSAWMAVSAIATIVDTEGVNLNPINTVSVLNTLQDWMNVYGSSTGINLASVVANGDGTVTVSNGEGTLRTTDSSIGELRPVTVPSTTLTPTDGETSYVVAEYNGGNPRFTISSTVTDISCRERCAVAVLYRSGNDVKVLDIANIANDFGALYTRREAVTGWLKRGSGLKLGFSGLNLTVTGGSLYNGINRYETPSFDTSDTDTFVVWYRDGTGGWNKTAPQSTITAAWWDDGSGTISTSDSSKWRKNLVYLQIDAPTTLHVVLGQEVYPNLAEAEAGDLPSNLPPWASTLSVGKFVGVEIHKGTDATITEVGTPFTDTLEFSSPTSHNNLAGLQGGTAEEYYHLTSAQHTIATQAASDTVSGYVNTGTQSIAGSKSFLDDLKLGSTALDGTGIRAFYDVSEGALRAGITTGNSWDSANRGQYSAAFGRNTVASGTYSFAAGDSADATGAAAVAFGSSTLASGVTSVAMGIRTTVSEQGGLICGVYGTAPNDALFTVANGTSTVEDEAFIVYNTGNVWVENNLSAQSITDRTPYPDSLQTAIDAVNSMQRLPDGEYDHDNKEKQLDHSVLHDYLKAGEVSRDMSATISCQNEVIKHLLEEIESLKARVSSLET